jgi:SAM-dependent methyltransferase
MSWHLDDEFWLALQGVIFDDQRIAGTRREVDGILAQTGVLPPATILDLGCGPGRHCLEFARRGYDVIGVDGCAAYLEQAEEAAEAEGLTVEWVEIDMHQFDADRPLDLALCLYSSFGYQTEAHDRALLSRTFRGLRPGGVFVMELMTQELFQEGIVSVDSFQEGELFIKRKIHWNGADLVRMNWEIHTPDGATRNYPTQFRLYNAPELVAMLQAAGFEPVDVRGDLLGAPFGEEAELLVLVAHKPRRRRA